MTEDRSDRTTLHVLLWLYESSRPRFVFLTCVGYYSCSVHLSNHNKRLLTYLLTYLNLSLSVTPRVSVLFAAAGRWRTWAKVTRRSPISSVTWQWADSCFNYATVTMPRTSTPSSTNRVRSPRRRLTSCCVMKSEFAMQVSHVTYFLGLRAFEHIAKGPEPVPRDRKGVRYYNTTR